MMLKKLLKEGLTPEEVKMKLNPPKEEEGYYSGRGTDCCSNRRSGRGGY